MQALYSHETGFADGSSNAKKQSSRLKFYTKAGSKLRKTLLCFLERSIRRRNVLNSYPSIFACFIVKVLGVVNRAR